MLDTPVRSGTQWTSIGVLAVLTIFILFFLERTSEKGLVQILKSMKAGRKARRRDEAEK